MKQDTKIRKTLPVFAFIVFGVLLTGASKRSFDKAA